MKFHENLSLLFEDVPFLERPAVAASCGLGAIECWWPIETANPRLKELRAFAAAIRATGVELVALNMHGGDFSGWERGLVAIPAAKERFRASVDAGVELATSLGCGVLMRSTVTWTRVFRGRIGCARGRKPSIRGRSSDSDRGRGTQFIGVPRLRPRRNLADPDSDQSSPV